MKRETLIKLAEHFGAIADIYQAEAEIVLAAQSPLVRDVVEPQSGVRYRKHKLEAKRVDGTARTGKNAGKPYVMWVCPKPRGEGCDYREFEDVKTLAMPSHVQPDLNPDDDIPF